MKGSWKILVLCVLLVLAIAPVSSAACEKCVGSHFNYHCEAAPQGETGHEGCTDYLGSCTATGGSCDGGSSSCDNPNGACEEFQSHLPLWNGFDGEAVEPDACRASSAFIIEA